MNTTETAHKAQETATQVIDQAKTLVDEARSSELASTATDVAHQVVERARDLATDLATRTTHKKQGKLRRLGSSIREHPKRYLFGTAAVGAVAAAVVNKRRHASAVTTTSNAPAYGADTPGYRTQPGPVTDMATETATQPSEPANR